MNYLETLTYDVDQEKKNILSRKKFVRIRVTCLVSCNLTLAVSLSVNYRMSYLETLGHVVDREKTHIRRLQKIDIMIKCSNQNFCQRFFEKNA